MKNFINIVDNFLNELSVKKYIFLILVLTYISILPFSFFLSQYNQGSSEVLLNSSSILMKLIIGSILVPIIETFFFQYLIINICKKYIKNKNWLIIIISSLFFAFSHYYNVIYIFYMFIVGFFLAYTYILYEKKCFHPFLVVTIIHALRNTIATIVNILN